MISMLGLDTGSYAFHKFNEEMLKLLLKSISLLCLL
jgi:hypothetical protein